MKAILIFCILNFAFIYIYPWLSAHQVYNHIVPGRFRLPFASDNHEMLAYNENLSDDYGAMFASHLIAGTPKKPNEYRVVLIGDSSIWGYNLTPSDILSEQLNKLSLSTCQGQQMRFYDLAYLGTYIPKDLLLLQYALQYQPNLVVWGVTLNALALNDTAHVAQMEPEANEILRLVRQYGLKIDTSALHAPTPYEETAIAQKSKIRRWAIFQLDGLLWGATGIDLDVRYFPALKNNLSPEITFDGNSFLNNDDLAFDVITIGYRIAGKTPILLFNEPMFVASGKNSSIRYNQYYPRWAYDQYRSFMTASMAGNGFSYVDLWNVIPPSQFGETSLHLTSAGEANLARHLAPEIQQMACR